MDFKNVSLLIRKEVRESSKNRWFVLYTICFVVLALLLLFLASSKDEIAGFSGFGRTAASLINLVLLFVPIISLVTGAISISNERESGTLSYLLSHPVTKTEVFLGKFIGLLLSIWISISLGFGLSGIIIALKGSVENISKYLITALLSVLLAASLLSLGFLISVISKKTAKAIGIAVFLWLVFLIFGDLGIMGTIVAMNLDISQIFILALLNPAEIFKIAAVLNISPRFEVLGPIGIYALKSFGYSGTFYLLFSMLVLWIAIPLGLGFLVFNILRRQE